MKRFTGRGRGRDIVGQLQLTWSGVTSTLAANTPALSAAETPPTSQSPPLAIENLPVARPTPPRGDGLTLLLKWDFSSTFPSPIEEAIEAEANQDAWALHVAEHSMLAAANAGPREPAPVEAPAARVDRRIMEHVS